MNASNSASVNTGTANNSGATNEIHKSMIGGDFDLGKISENIINKIAEYFNSIFEPVQLSF